MQKTCNNVCKTLVVVSWKGLNPAGILKCSKSIHAVRIQHAIYLGIGELNFLYKALGPASAHNHLSFQSYSH